MTAPIIPAGAANLADLLAEWRTVINAKLGGGLKVKTADTSRSSTTTFANDPHLVVPVAANTVYAVEHYGVYFANAGGQYKVQMTFPAGATMEAGSWEYDPGTDEWAAVSPLSSSTPYLFVSGLVGGVSNIPYRLTGSLHVGATAGNLTLQWAQTTSNASATILRKGSWLRVMATT